MTNPTVSTKRAELFWAKVTKQPSCCARSRTTDPTKMRPSKRAAPLVDGAA